MVRHALVRQNAALGRRVKAPALCCAAKASLHARQRINLCGGSISMRGLMGRDVKAVRCLVAVARANTGAAVRAGSNG